METGSKKRGNAKGDTSAIAASRVRARRQDLGRDLVSLSERLADLDWPIPVAALSRLENGLRRIDVDDLVALSVALETTPMDLLFDPSKETGPYGTALPDDLLPVELNNWKNGNLSLTPESRLDFLEARAEKLKETIQSLKPEAERVMAAVADSDEEPSKLVSFFTREFANMHEEAELLREQIEKLRVQMGHDADA